jgi:DNA-binding SARP family transcriptional activator/tetratricopeptide (TPR) repeat protein/transcriptional regulator with XRE-family HTH domain
MSDHEGANMGHDGAPLPGHLGRSLRAHRAAAGLTQDQLARRAGVSRGALRDIEQGRTAWPRQATVARLAGALALTARQRAELAAARPGSRRPDGAAPDPPAAAGAGGAHAGARVTILGPFAAWRDGTPLALGPARQRAVLGLLVLHEGVTLSRTSVIDALWDDPPATAGEMIQGYVSRLRRLLWADGGAGDGALPRLRAALCRDGAGYRLSVGAVASDLREFGQLSDGARRSAAAGDAGPACGLYRQALGLWRGAPFADLEVLRGHPAVAELGRRHADVVMEYADVAAEAGQPATALGSLWALAGQEPLDERAHARLMTALAATGQRAAALRLYADIRERLSEELGVRPGPELSAAHLRLLRQDGPPAAAPARSAAPAGPGGGHQVAAAGVTVPRRGRRRRVPGGQRAHQPGAAVPRQLPPHGGHFTGRAGELAVLTGLLEQAAAGGPGTAVISAIGGTAGVGKTALGVRWAHQVAGRFPDGQLYVNLRGHDPQQPMPATEALAGFLRALGVPGQDVPADPDERAARYRSLLAGRRTLVFLDNAGSVEQVRPLLPGTHTCVTIVTSRDSLAGLVVRDGATRLDLDLLPLAEAVTVLRDLIGERVDADPAAAVTLAGQCARLPLALRVAAELAAARPGAPLADLVRELDDRQRRLDLLDAGGDPRTAVRAVFSWSYRHLDAAAARTFRLAGLHPGEDLDACAAAALTGVTVADAGQALDRLSRAHLIQPARPGPYLMHDLLRAYARELAASEDGQHEQRAALTRLLDYYLQAAAAAADTLFPADRARRPGHPPPAGPVPVLTGPAPAREWLDAQRASLIAVTAHAAAHGWPGHATAMAATLFRYLDTGGHYPEAITLHTHARRAAQHAGDPAAEATALISLGAAHWRQSRYPQAARHYRQALAICQQTGDRAGQTRALGNLGLVAFQQGCYPQAADYFGQVLAIFRDTGDRSGQARALGNLGDVGIQLGHYQQASDHYQQALAICRETGDRPGQARALGNLGDVGIRLGRYQEAGDHARLALALFRAAGDRMGEASALGTLGEVAFRQGQHGPSADHFQQALAVCRDTGDRSGEAHVLNSLGDAFLAAGRPGEARAQCAAALSLASQIGQVHEQARSHSGLARSYSDTGEHGQARRHWHEALRLYTSLGAREAQEIRARLAGSAAGRGRA